VASAGVIIDGATRARVVAWRDVQRKMLENMAFAGDPDAVKELARRNAQRLRSR
jgi:hypothetical protein